MLSAQQRPIRLTASLGAGNDSANNPNDRLSHFPMKRLSGFLIQLLFIATVTLLAWMLTRVSGSRRIGVAAAVLIAIIALVVYIKVNWRDRDSD